MSLANGLFSMVAPPARITRSKSLFLVGKQLIEFLDMVVRELLDLGLDFCWSSTRGILSFAFFFSSLMAS